MCHSTEELDFWLRRTTEPLVQEYLLGDEITADVLCDLAGRPQYAVQRKRLKVRGGEVERGVTVDYPVIADYALRIAAALKPRGVINVQCFLTAAGPKFTEVNPRFGGGYPLAQAAGADFPERIVAMLNGGDARPLPVCRTGVVMMRFDEAVYRNQEELEL